MFVTLLQPLTHYSLHILAPAAIAIWCCGKDWLRVYAILLATMLVDLDHLFATPIFDPHRHSIGFHPLHTYAAISLYVIMLWFPRLRWIAIGLLFHMGTDTLDALWMG